MIKLAYNVLEYDWINGQKTVNTIIEMPKWCTADILKELLFKKPVFHISKLKFTHKSIDFEDIVSKLTGVEWLDGKFQHIDGDKILEIVKKEIPVDGKEILEWMHPAFAANSAISIMSENYIDVNGLAVGRADDPYVPGLVVDDLSFIKEPASVLSENGYARLKSPYGIDRIPLFSKRTVIKQKLLAWAAHIFQGYTQWTGAIVKWLKLPVNPKKALPNIRISGLTAPIFLAHIPPRFGFKNVVTMEIASEKDQKVDIYYRDPRNFSVAFFKLSVPVRGNSINRIKFKIRSLSGVPPMVVQYETPDNGLITVNSYDVKASLIPI